jgi:hypothetical protein
MKRQQLWLDVKEPDQAALKRILAAVKHDVPGDLDEAALLTSLQNAVQLYLAGVMMRDEPAKQRKRGDKIIAACTHLKGLLDDGENPPVTCHHPSHYCEALDVIIVDVNKVRALAEHFGHRLGLRQRSAFEHLIGILHKAFETHFKVKSRYTRSDFTETVEGPFIEFAEAVLDETDIRSERQPFSRHSIASALTGRRKRRNT